MTKLLSAAAGCLLSLAAASHASTTTLDFEEFAAGDDLEGLDLGGVTITSPAVGVTVFDGSSSAGSNSGARSIASRDIVSDVIFTFDNAVSFVELFGGDGPATSDADTWTFDVYDAQVGGNLLGTLTSSPLVSGHSSLSFSIAGILRAEASSTTRVSYDDLTFTTVSQVPVPAAALLFAPAAARFARRRRRSA